MNKFDGVIFDMDGLLFDTEMIYYASSQKVADEMGFAYDKELYLRFLGVSDEEVQESYHQLFQEHGREAVEEFIQRSYADTIHTFESGAVELKTGVLELLDFLEECNIPKLVASSNVRPAIELLLNNAGIKNRFQRIVSAEDVTRAKPDPEIFQKAVSFLGTDPERTLVLEDSSHGINAAYAAGIPVIMIPDLLQPDQELRDKTLQVFDSLLAVPPYLKN